MITFGLGTEPVLVDGCVLPLSFEEFVLACAEGRDVRLPVKGWREPWRCEFSGGFVRVACPTANINPIVLGAA